jgi:hypothetical protein
MTLTADVLHELTKAAPTDAWRLIVAQSLYKNELIQKQ